MRQYLEAGTGKELGLAYQRFQQTIDPDPADLLAIAGTACTREAFIMFALPFEQDPTAYRL